MKKTIIFLLLIILLLTGCSEKSGPLDELKETYREKVETAGKTFPEIAPDVWNGILANLTEADADSDWHTLAKDNGHIVVHITDNYLSHERTAVLLLQIKDVMDKADVPFARIDFFHALWNSDAYIHVSGFPYSEIYEEDLAARLEVQFEIQRPESGATEGG